MVLYVAQGIGCISATYGGDDNSGGDDDILFHDFVLSFSLETACDHKPESENDANTRNSRTIPCGACRVKIALHALIRSILENLPQKKIILSGSGGL